MSSDLWHRWSQKEEARFKKYELDVDPVISLAVTSIAD